MPSPEPALNAEIAAVLAALCACWTELRLADIADLWDADEPLPFLLPQEIAAPLVGWEALRDYLAKAQARLTAASMRIWNLNVKRLAPDLAVALYEMHWNGDIRGMGLFGVDTRATAVFRKRNDAWRICHYVEAPPALSLQLQRAYASAVDPDFRARVTGAGAARG